MNKATILVVCTANICRSPVGAALLGAALAGSGITVLSAGTHAVEGQRTVPEAIEYVGRRTDVPPPLEASPLSAALARSAGLVLTMTAAQRAYVARSAPSTLRRTFTLRQFARISPLLPSGVTYPSVEQVAEAVARVRPISAPVPSGEDDIDDPYGRSPEQYRQSFDLIARNCALTAEVLLSTVSAQGPSR